MVQWTFLTSMSVQNTYTCFLWSGLCSVLFKIRTSSCMSVVLFSAQNLVRPKKSIRRYDDLCCFLLFRMIFWLVSWTCPTSLSVQKVYKALFWTRVCSNLPNAYGLPNVLCSVQITQNFTHSCHSWIFWDSYLYIHGLVDSVSNYRTTNLENFPASSLSKT
jgi:hypothetical protein